MAILLKTSYQLNPYLLREGEKEWIDERGRAKGKEEEGHTRKRSNWI
jgi:hypothetical protein